MAERDIVIDGKWHKVDTDPPGCFSSLIGIAALIGILYFIVANFLS